jgi:8-oxo-dGTP diphosphatase
MKYNTIYQPPVVTVDLVLMQVIDRKLTVMLLNRSSSPFKGQWALPGGYVPQGETTRQALRRHMLEKIGLDTESLAYLDQLYVFDAAARDPRGHAVSIIYLGIDNQAKTSRDAATVAAFAVDNLIKLPFDHNQIIDFSRQQLVKEVDNTVLVRPFLPALFTLSELQQVHEAILGRPLDKRNFRKRLLATGQLVETDKLKYHTNSRPAKLYKFKSPRSQDRAHTRHFGKTRA